MWGRSPMTGRGVANDPELGTIIYTVRRQAKRFVARWKGGELHLTVPAGADMKDTREAIEQMKPRLITRKPQTALYRFDDEMRFELLTVTIRGTEGYGKRCTLHHPAPGHFEIRTDSRADLSDAETMKAVSSLMKSIARYLAPQTLLPRATEIAAALDVRPSEWKISSGRKVLGRCSSRRVIALSAVLVFAPAELRDYVICHELAHLSEMNHSARFHALCDRYCQGRAAELERKLKSFAFPVL